MIGAGIGNLAAAVYLIRDGGWRGDQITILGLDTHGANDGAAVKKFGVSTGTTRWAIPRVSSTEAGGCSTRKPTRTSGM